MDYKIAVWIIQQLVTTLVLSSTKITFYNYFFKVNIPVPKQPTPPKEEPAVAPQPLLKEVKEPSPPVVEVSHTFIIHLLILSIHSYL